MSLLTSILFLDTNTGHILYQYTPKVYSAIIPMYTTLNSISPLLQSFVQLGRELKGVGSSVCSLPSSSSMNRGGGPTSTSFSSSSSSSLSATELVVFQRVRFNYEETISIDQYNQLLTFIREQSIANIPNNSSSEISSNTGSTPSSSTTTSSTTGLFLEAIYTQSTMDNNLVSDTKYYLVGLTVNIPSVFSNLQNTVNNYTYLWNQLQKAHNVWINYYTTVSNNNDKEKNGDRSTMKTILSEETMVDDHHDLLQEQFANIFHISG